MQPKWIRLSQAGGVLWTCISRKMEVVGFVQRDWENYRVGLGKQGPCQQRTEKRYPWETAAANRSSHRGREASDRQGLQLIWKRREKLLKERNWQVREESGKQWWMLEMGSDGSTRGSNGLRKMVKGFGGPSLSAWLEVLQYLRARGCLCMWDRCLGLVIIWMNTL